MPGFGSTPQAVSTSVASNLTTLTTTYATAGSGLTSTLAAGTNGQIKILSMITDGGGDMVVTVTNPFWGGAGAVAETELGVELDLAGRGRGFEVC